MKKFPSIEQFRNVVREVKTKHDFKGLDESGDPIYSHDDPYPILDFVGTVKLHGTNASIVKYSNGEIKFQSRESEISPSQDNAGFATYMSSQDISGLFSGLPFNDYIAIYGEWCGGNIQKGVAINGLPKMFIIFGIKIDDIWYDVTDFSDVSFWESNWNPINIYHINQFPTFRITIDFNYPQLSQNDLIELTKKVEDECPVGKYFGNSGVGEGIVWNCLGDKYRDLVFKVKGDKHSVSRVSKPASVDIANLEDIKDFVELSVQEARLLQGLDKLRENGKVVNEKSTGDFIRWVVKDVMKEEADTIESNKFDLGKINSLIAQKSREWYFDYIRREIFS